MPFCRNFDETTSVRVEVENRHHKEDSTIHSQTSMAANVKAVTLRMNKRATEKSHHHLQYLKKPLSTSDSSVELSPITPPLWFREQFTYYCNKLLSEQWELSFNYMVNIKSPTQALVMYSSSTSDHKVRVINHLSSSSQLVCSCMYIWCYALPCRHLLCVIRKFSLPFGPHHIHLRWHKSYALGMFLKIYHRSFLDGYIGVYSASEFPFIPISDEPVISDMDIDTNSSIPSDLPSTLPSVPMSSSSSSTTIDTYQLLVRAFEGFKKDVIGSCSHSSEATSWALTFIKNSHLQFLQDYNQEFITSSQGSFFDPTVISDLPPNRSRALFSHERSRKRKRKVAKRTLLASSNGGEEEVLFLDRLPVRRSGRLSQPSPSSSQSPGTPPLIVDDVFISDDE